MGPMAVSLGRLEVETADHVVLRYDLAGGGNRGFAALVDFILATLIFIGAFFMFTTFANAIGVQAASPYFGIAVLLTFALARHAGWTAHAIELEGSDPRDIVPPEGRLVAAEREAVRLPAIESEKRGALPGREVEEGGVERHVRPARAGGVDEQRPAHGKNVNGQQSTVNGTRPVRENHRV